MNSNQQRIQELAHQIWEAEGKPHNQAVRHWETACKLVAAENENFDPAMVKQLNEAPLPDSELTNTPTKKTRKSKVVAEDETLLSVVPKTQKKSSAKKSKSTTS